MNEPGKSDAILQPCNRPFDLKKNYRAPQLLLLTNSIINSGTINAMNENTGGAMQSHS